MSDMPDLSSLPARMRYAANVIQEAQLRDETFRTEYYNHSHDGVGVKSLLFEAGSRFEAEDRAAAERDQLVEELARDIGHLVYMMTPDRRLNEMWLDQARALIESGWRKGESA